VQPSGSSETPHALRRALARARDGKVLDIDRQVTPSTHGRDVAAKLAELGVKRRSARR